MSFPICDFLVSGCAPPPFVFSPLREVPLPLVGKAVFWVLNSLSFCLSVKLLIFFSNLTESLAG